MKMHITLGGQNIAVEEVEIPDMWHLAMTYPNNSPERLAILAVWHLAHACRNRLLELEDLEEDKDR